MGNEEPEKVVFSLEEMASVLAELKATKEKLAVATAPPPVRPKSKSEQKAELELKYARECRRETPNLTRGGIKLPVKGSGSCADHGTNGKES